MDVIPTDLAETVAIAKRAAQVATRYIHTDAQLHTHIKDANKTNLVTAADEECERMLVAWVRANYPEDSILAEEGGAQFTGTSGLTWVIDPIDGTKNLVRRDGPWGPGLSRIDAEGRVLLSVVISVYHSMVWETFASVADGPLFVNGAAQAPCPAGPSLGEADMLTPIRTKRTLRYPRELDAHVAAAGDVLWPGASLHALASVAVGRRHAYFAPVPHPWDWYPGAGLAVAAGCTVGKVGPFWYAAAPGCAEELIHHLTEVVRTSAH